VEQVLLNAGTQLAAIRIGAPDQRCRDRDIHMARHKADVVDDDFEIYASYHGTGDGRYIGGLKVVRKADRRILFPFDGAPEIGPYATADEARRAAIDYGREIVAADRAAPEK
jgi:hypothetical protein